jgi:hypothetical protein
MRIECVERLQRSVLASCARAKRNGRARRVEDKLGAVGGDGENVAHARPRGIARGSQADVLARLLNSAKLFHTPDERCFAAVYVNGHRRVLEIGGIGFRDLLLHRYYQATGTVPNAEAVKGATRLFAAQARFDGEEHQAHVRVAHQDGCIYLDLADAQSRCVEVRPGGWNIVSEPPVYFLHPPGMLPLPVPVRGSSVQELYSLLNLPSERDFVLVTAWLLGTLMPCRAHPILLIRGSHGSCKTQTTAFLKSLVDPSSCFYRALPKNPEDLQIAAMNAHVLAFDNISSVPDWLSDALCRLATGSGYGTRQRYTDRGEVLFDAVRPVILNGIPNFVEREDLADRCLGIELRPPDGRLRTTDDLFAEFEEARPRILGALLDLVAHGLQCRPHIRTDWLPRMADFAAHAMACETALWPSGTFKQAFLYNQQAIIDSAIDADPVATAICRLMRSRTMRTMRTLNSKHLCGYWSGTASALMTALRTVLDDAGETGGTTWPKTAHALSNRVHRAELFLRKTGIHIEYTREGHDRTRLIHITAPLPPNPRAPSVQPGLSEPFEEEVSFEEAERIMCGKGSESKTVADAS